MLLRYIEVGFFLVTIILGFSQIVIPLWRGRPLLPMFNRRREAEKKLGEVVEAVEVRNIESIARKLNKRGR